MPFSIGKKASFLVIYSQRLLLRFNNSTMRLWSINELVYSPWKLLCAVRWQVASMTVMPSAVLLLLGQCCATELP